MDAQGVSNNVKAFEEVDSRQIDEEHKRPGGPALGHKRRGAVQEHLWGRSREVV